MGVTSKGVAKQHDTKYGFIEQRERISVVGVEEWINQDDNLYEFIYIDQLTNYWHDIINIDQLAQNLISMISHLLIN